MREGQDHSWLTGVYWTLTVMSTLGFGDITFTSDLGRLFSIVVLLSGIFMLLIVLPFASNLLVRVYAWIMLLGPVGLLYTPAAVIAGMVYVHLPFMALPLYTNLERHDPALLEAARDLGADRWTSFRRITWPLSLPGVLSGSALVFIPVLGMFAIPELLGGTGDMLIGNLIKEQFLDNRDWPLGSALSLALTAAVLGVAGLASLAARGGRR
jgi:spermidine/putrescine transport system permease protein